VHPSDVISGRFELEAVAGTGGMGTVWRSLDLESGDRVALKLLPSQPGWEAERLVREARVLAELHHPAIVRYVAHGTTEEGSPYLAMEWLEGESLADRLSRTGLSLDESLELCRSTRAWS
jgi:serine/threonine protein kinase